MNAPRSQGASPALRRVGVARLRKAAPQDAPWKRERAAWVTLDCLVCSRSLGAMSQGFETTRHERSYPNSLPSCAASVRVLARFSGLRSLAGGAEGGTEDGAEGRRTGPGL